MIRFQKDYIIIKKKVSILKVWVTFRIEIFYKTAIIKLIKNRAIARHIKTKATFF